MTHFTNGNLIHQRWLDNNFTGLVFSYNTNNARTEHTLGGAVNIYNGRHFGKVIWHEYMTGNGESFNYYGNKSLKMDGNIYWKVQHRFTKKLSGFADLQFRPGLLRMVWPKSMSESQDQNIAYLFFNPKAGIQFQPKTNVLMYVACGRGSHEPIWDDFVNSGSSSRPKPEFMNNIEAAYKSNTGDWKYAFTGYYMLYKNQWLLVVR